MDYFKTASSVVLATVFVAATSPAHAHQLTVKEVVNSHSMLEAVANGYYQIQQEFGLDRASEISWTGTYGEWGWTAEISGTLYGQPVFINYVAATGYDADQNAISRFSGRGANGTESITIDGTADWHFDPAAGGYTRMDFTDHGDVQTPRLKWWVAAAEIIGGGILGGAAAGVGGAIVGAGFGLACSEAGAATTLNGADPPEPTRPGAPALPRTVSEAEILVATDTQIITRIYGSGRANATVRNQVMLDATWRNGRVEGFGAVCASPDDNADGDGLCGAVDNCPGAFNPDQTDTDADGLGDACDPSPYDSVDSYCPCDGGWRTHDQYLVCVRAATANLQSRGLISARQATLIQRAAEGRACPK